MRILLIEDNTVVRDCVQELLAYMGHDCHASAGGEEVYDLISCGFDAVLTDLDMPDVTGFEILAYSAAQQYDLPVIEMSGRPDPALPPDTPFLRKPFTVQQLENLLRLTLSYSRSTDDHDPLH